jgi:hypothetical protein
MTQPISDQYFYTGAFAGAGPELFASYTCMGCGVRLKTWDGFDVHRRECSRRLSATGAVFGTGLTERLLALGREELPVAVVQPRIEVVAPLSLVPAAPTPVGPTPVGPTPVGPTAAVAPAVRATAEPLTEHDPFLDAPPAALILLERWRKEEEQERRLDAA